MIEIRVRMFQFIDSDFISFADEKAFHVASPVNMQNDQLECTSSAMSRSVKSLLNGLCVVSQLFQVADGFNCRLKADVVGSCSLLNLACVLP